GAGTSTISPASVATNGSGVATFTVKDANVENVTYTATDTTDSTAITQTAAVSFTAGAVSAASSTVSSSPGSVVADGSTTSTITVTLKDAFGHNISGKTVSLGQGAGTSTISPESVATNGSGVATFTVKTTTAQSV